MFTISMNIKHLVRLRPIQMPVFSYSKKITQLKSNEEREAAIKKQRLNFVHTIVTTKLKNRKFMPASEWKLVVAEIQKDPAFKSRRLLVSRSIFSILLSLKRPNDSLQNAKNFIESFELEYDLGVKRFMIEVYAKKASQEKLNETDEMDLLNLCNELIDKDFHILPEMNSIVVMGLCSTKEWRRALELPKPTFNSLNILARKTLRENDMINTWTVLNKLPQLPKQYRKLASKTIVTFAKYFEKFPNEIPHHAEQLFELCKRLQIVFDETTIKQLTNVLQKNGFQANITNINQSVCRICKNNLEEVQISDENFSTLQNEFLNNVVKGFDIYQKTTPKEWEAFERTIKENGPFDIVMDGLNVAYSLNPRNKHVKNTLSSTQASYKQKPCAFSLSNAVEQLVKEGKRVLVVGREHMNRWPKMDQIRRIATIFLVENISKDDIFLLYAAIQSGKNAYILSNDYMRQHKFAIGPKYNALFKKWQQEHWYGFTFGTNKAIDLIKPMAFKMYTHKTGAYWHLPYKTTVEIESKTWNQYENPKNWACIRIEKENNNDIENNEFI